jgi:hypothetical protein
VWPGQAVGEALLVTAATAAGVGEGKLQADISNLTALMKVRPQPVPHRASL